jgi:competence protein ComEA
MEIDELKAKYLSLLREHWVAVVLGIVGVGFIGYGLMQLLVAKGDSSEITFQSGEQQSISEKKKPFKEIVVDVEGAVLKPGIYKLQEGSRVQDALIAAGGMDEHADRAKVAKGMNLAAKVIDGGKVYIPFEGDPSTSSGQTISQETVLGVQTGMVNINTASETELDSLSGVGPSTAQKIISARPYSSIEELVTKKAVGKSVFEKIKEKVTLQ